MTQFSDPSAIGKFIPENVSPIAFQGKGKVLPPYYQEWLGSCVDPGIIELNVKFLSGTVPYSYLLYSPKLKRRNDGRLVDRYLKRYGHSEHGGWWCDGGYNPVTGAETEWGCFKPDRPITDLQKNKQIKYEHPPKIETEIFCLNVLPHIWKGIAQCAQIDFPCVENMSSSDILIAFWEWVKKNPSIPIIICEGAKKAGCLLTASYVAIALPGIWGGYRKSKDSSGQMFGLPSLIPQLAAFAQPGREFVFCFDRDRKPKTRQNVKTATLKTGKLLTAKGCKVSVIDWTYPEKGVDDLIAARGKETFDVLYEFRQSLDEYKLKDTLDLTPYVSLRVSQRYLDKNLVPPAGAQIIGIKSAKNTGKTQWLASIVENWIKQVQRVVVVTHRIQLAKILAAIFGIDHIEEIRSSDTKGVLGYSLCSDSMHSNSMARFSPDDWDGALVILDEAEQVIWHMLASQTCTENRVPILQNFQALLQKVIGTGGKIILSDADLSAISLTYIQKLIGEPVQTWIVENTFKPNEGKRKLFTYDSPEALLAAIGSAVSKGERVMVHTSAQKTSSKYSTINLERLLGKLTDSILRIDAESVADPNHRAYGLMPVLNSELIKYQVALASPVIETGISIHVDHFDKVFCFAFGVQTVDAVCQTVERVRTDVPRHVFLKKTSSSCIGNGSTEIKSLLKSQHQLFKANLASLALNDALASLDEVQPESLQTWAKYACIQNLGYRNYRKAILEKLAASGYSIDSGMALSSSAKAQIKTEVKLNMETNHEEFCEKVSAAFAPTPSELESLSKKRAKTEEERLKEYKGILEQRYGAEVTPELVRKDKEGWYGKLLVHYYLTVGKQFKERRDNFILKKLVEKGNGVAWKPDVNRKLKSFVIRTLELLDIKQFLQPGVEFTNATLLPWFEKISQPIPRSQIKTILGVSINPDKMTPIQAAQILLRLLGLRLTCTGRPGTGSTRLRTYRYEPVDDGRGRVFEEWLRRDFEFVSIPAEDIDLFINSVDAA